MRGSIPKTLVALVLVALVAHARAETVDLSHRAVRDWDIVLPRESSSPVSGAIQLAGRSFAVESDGASLRIDTDGDGVTDASVGGEGALVTLRAPGRGGADAEDSSADGAGFTYSIRLRHDGAWRWSTASVLRGTVAGQRVRLVDQNLNGRFDDVGEDAVVVGRGRHASYLGRTLFVRGELLAVEVAEAGARIETRPYEGPTGRLDLTSDLATKGKLLAALVRSEDGQHSFTVARSELVVPVGTYLVEGGGIALGRNELEFSRGEISPIAVEAGKTARLALGEPIRIDFEFLRDGSRVILAPQLVRYLGRAGEEYASWSPFGGSPEFVLTDTESEAEIARAVFGGT